MSRNAIVVAVALACALLAAPALRAGFTTDGAPVAVYANEQDDQAICADGAGGAFVAWVDRRPYADIYAQRIDANGRAHWTANGIAVCGATNSQYVPAILPDNAGGAIVAWQDRRSGSHYDVYVQRVDGAGTMLWTTDGVAATAAAGDQTGPRLCPDGAGGCIVVWKDARNGSSNCDIYAQRIDVDGLVRWAADGVAVCAYAGNQDYPVAATDGGGGAYVTWFDGRAGWHVYAQRLDGAGVPRWTADGMPVCAEAGMRYDLCIVPDGDRGAILLWCDNRSFYDLYAQRLDTLGVECWGSADVLVCGEAEQQINCVMVSDDAGGAIVAWKDTRGDDPDIYAQRIDAAGTPKWAASGLPLCTLTGGSIDPCIVSDGASGAIVAWTDARHQLTTWNDIYAQHVDSLGVCSWTPGGDSLCCAADTQRYPKAASDGAGGAIVCWEDRRSMLDYDIYAQRITDEGELVATLLASFEAAASPAGVSLAWRLSSLDGGVRFRVLRAPDPAGGFVELDPALVVAEGRSFSLLDASARRGETYVYRVAIDGGPILFETAPVTMPSAAVSLLPNRPNPFNPSTAIGFELPGRMHVRLSVHDVAGRLVATLVDEVRGGGIHAVEWDGTTDGGQAVASGAYFCRLSAGKRTVVRKMVLVR